MKSHDLAIHPWFGSNQSNTQAKCKTDVTDLPDSSLHPLGDDCGGVLSIYLEKLIGDSAKRVKIINDNRFASLSPRCRYRSSRSKISTHHSSMS